jgi:[CysO sulfur-carrier protein]-S-L-cysteine hydrolase
MSRYARQVRLAEVGAAGQARIAGALADVPLDGLAADVAALYLAGAGVGRLRLRSDQAAAAARSINAEVDAEVDASLQADPGADAFDLRHSAARDVARGAGQRQTFHMISEGRMRDVMQHPWIEGELVVSRSVLNRVDEEARGAYARDEESCGFLVGPASAGRRVDGVVPMQNRANALHRLDPAQYPRTGRMYFDIDSMKFEAALRRGAAEGRPVKVLYHSHLDAGAYFSATDAEVAKMGQGEPPWDLAYLVTSVRAGQVDDRKLFIWEPASRTFVESALEVDEGA